MNNFDGIKKIHLMGIGGAGVSGLALLLKSLGFEVSGCDLKPTPYTLGHDAAHISEFSPDLLIYTNAIPQNNPELLAARAKIKVIGRGDALSWIFNEKFGIGIAGAHGKTTTSSMLAFLLDRAGLAPSLAVGGEVIDVGANARLGASDIMVAELDESDGSFESFFPSITVITNIDWDHVDHFKTMQDVEDAFERFAVARKTDSPLIICADDVGAKKLIKKLQGRGDQKIIKYGLDKNFDWSAERIEFRQGGGVSYSLLHKGKFLGVVSLKISGLHNVLNSLAVCAAADILKIESEKFIEILKNFSGAKRRFQFVGQVGELKIYDDYGHHPVEIKATLDAFRHAFPDEKINVAFQPHRYTRTKQLYKEFAHSLSFADRVFLLPIYSADEPPIESVSSELIANSANDDIIPKISVPFYVCSGVEDLFVMIDEHVKNGLFITLGAGSVTEVGYDYLSRKNVDIG